MKELIVSVIFSFIAFTGINSIVVIVFLLAGAFYGYTKKEIFSMFIPGYILYLLIKDLK